MKSRITKCIDSGSEFCPCKLAESNECLICTQMQGDYFCDCCNWNGICIYQEFINNGKRAKEGRKIFKCNIIESYSVNEDLIYTKIEVSHKLALDLRNPGSYIFIKPDENEFYNIPISIMEVDIDKNSISFLIYIKGIKTKKFLENLKEKDTLNIKAPFWNGIFGIDNLNKVKNEEVILISKSIGLAPSIPVIRRLNSNNNNIKIYLDCDDKEFEFFKEHIKGYDINIIRKKVFSSGELEEDFKLKLKEDIKNCKFIFSSGADILIKKIIEFLDYMDRKDIKLACSNNFTMCCGEGICGACTIRFKGGITRRFCKEQVDPRELFEGRRYI